MLTVTDVKAFDKIPQSNFFSFSGNVILSKEFIPLSKEPNKTEYIPLMSRAFTFLTGVLTHKSKALYSHMVQQLCYLK